MAYLIAITYYKLIYGAIKSTLLKIEKQHWGQCEGKF